MNCRNSGYKSLKEFNNGKEVIAFGDSNTEGSNWKIYDYDPAKKWVALLSNYYEKRILNAGVGGNTTEQARDRFVKDVLSRNPRTVFIMFGTNDAQMINACKPRVDKETFRRNLQYFTEELKREGALPVLMTCLPVIEGDGITGYYYSRHNKKWYDHVGGARKWHNSFNSLVRYLSETNDIPIIDIWNKFIEAAGSDDDPSLIASGLLDPSGTHLSPAGAEYVFKLITESDDIH